MSVYVDALMSCTPNKNWKWNKACHLFADTIEELHVFAKRIGLKRSWFQNGRRLKHYDLTPNMRKKAIACNAVESTREKIVLMIDSRKGVL